MAVLNITLEDQVCTLQQGLRLEELHVNVQPLFMHVKQIEGIEGLAKDKVLLWLKNSFDYDHSRIFWEAPAYTAGELGEMLPPYVHTIKSNKGWKVVISMPRPAILDRWDEVHGYRIHGTEAIARAHMLVWLVNHKLISADEISGRK